MTSYNPELTQLNEFEIEPARFLRLTSPPTGQLGELSSSGTIVRSFDNTLTTSEEAATPDDDDAIEQTRAVRRVCLAQRVSICFVLDTTASMGKYITEVKNQVNQVMDKIKESGCHMKNVAFVGYKDWKEEEHDEENEDHFEVLDFTDDIGLFQCVIDSIEAGGGYDQAEDVIGGLEKVLHLTWPDEVGATRVVFHIGDAPPHGSDYHDDIADEYADFDKMHPKQAKLETVVQGFKSLGIQYYFGKLNSYCDKMIEAFTDAFEDVDMILDTFDITDLDSIWKVVVEAAMESISLRSSLANTNPVSNLPDMIREYPDFDELELMTVEIYRHEGMPSMQGIVNFDAIEMAESKLSTFKVAPHPFTHGSERIVYYGQRIFRDDDSVEDVVLKEFIKPSRSIEHDERSCMVALETQTVAAKLAFEFNALLRQTEHRAAFFIKFLKSKMAKFLNPTRFMLYESQFHDGHTLVKFTNNYNFVRSLGGRASGESEEIFQEKLDLVTAFSHFSFIHSGGYLLVCDLQGVVGDEPESSKRQQEIILTDTAIHCSKHPARFGVSNLGKRGIEGFFITHKCNKYCKLLHLPQL